MSTLDDLLAVLRTQESAFDADLETIDRASHAERGALFAGIRNTYLGRKSGAVSSLMAQLASLASTDKKEFGRRVNDFKSRVESALAERETRLAASRRPA